MRLFLLPTVFAFAAATVAADDKADADLKAMVGKWQITKADLGGKDVMEHLKDMRFEIAGGGKYVVQVGEEKDAGSFTVDVSKSPREMDIKPTGGPDKGKTIKAIYKLDGDTVTICYELGGGDRPAKFESKPDTKQFLAVYKRLK